MTMRTTIRLNDELLAQAKQLAARTNRSLAAVVEDALRLSLGVQAQDLKREPVRLRTFKGRGVLPGVDLDRMR